VGVLNVSASGYCAWRDRPPCRRAFADTVLTERMRAIHADSAATCGMPRVRAELIDQGVCIIRKHLARLMRSAGLRELGRRRGFVVTARRDESLSQRRPIWTSASSSPMARTSCG
jgi:putative transposase